MPIVDIQVAEQARKVESRAQPQTRFGARLGAQESATLQTAACYL